jgi:hypothetical protein
MGLYGSRGNFNFPMEKVFTWDMLNFPWEFHESQGKSCIPFSFSHGSIDFQTNGKENLTKNLLLSQKNDFSPAKVLNNSFINSILYDKKKQTRFFFIVKQK